MILQLLLINDRMRISLARIFPYFLSVLFNFQ
nr:MAG TPA: hypothetical protein [Caudoviricetes sp.]